MNGLYEDPTVYDILQTPGTAHEVDVLQRVAAAHGAPDGLWYEPACGTGRYLRVLRGRGVRVGGSDLDPGMVAYAARRLGRRVRVAGMTDPVVPGVRPGSVAVAFNPVNTIRLLPSDAAMREHFAQVARLLAPGGLYLVGISLTDYEGEQPSEDLWQATRGRCRVSQLVNYLPPEVGSRREIVLSHLLIVRPRGSEHRDERYELRCYDEEQWNRLVRGSALRRVGSCDMTGRPVADRALAYQLEVLAPKR